MDSTLAISWRLLRRETASWGKTLAAFLLFFMLTTATINLAYGLFGFDLIPVFENTLGELRRFLHTAFEYLIYWPLNTIVSWIMRITFDIRFNIPELAGWYIDLVLLSMILSRAERAAMKIAEPIKDESNVQRSVLERFVWIVVLIFYLPTKALVAPFRKYAPKFVSEPIRVFLDGVTLLGIWFLLHDYSILRSQKGRSVAAVQSHKVFLLLMAVSILAAFVASGIFFVVNGYLHHYYQ